MDPTQLANLLGSDAVAGLSQDDLAALSAGLSDPGNGGSGAVTAGPQYALASSSGMMISPAAKTAISRGAALLGAALAFLPAEMIGAAGVAIATVVGANLSDITTAFLKKKSRHRRARGITGRQLAIARRTIGKVENMHRALAHAFGRAHHRTAAAPFARRKK